jgi:hypothetical protein
MDHKLIYLVHILFVAPLLMYSGYVGRNLSDSNKAHKSLFEFLFVVGLVVALYHSYKLFRIISL